MNFYQVMWQIQNTSFAIVAVASTILFIWLLKVGRHDLGYSICFGSFAVSQFSNTSQGGQFIFQLTGSYGIAKILGSVGTCLAMVTMIQSLIRHQQEKPYRFVIGNLIYLAICVCVFYFFVLTPTFIEPAITQKIAGSVPEGMYDLLISLIGVEISLVAIWRVRSALEAAHHTEKYRFVITLFVFIASILFFVLGSTSSLLYVYGYIHEAKWAFVLCVFAQIMGGALIPLVFLPRNWLYRVSLPFRYLANLYDVVWVARKCRASNVPLPPIKDMLKQPSYYTYVMNIAIVDQQRGKKPTQP